MASKQHILRFIDAGSEIRRPPLVGMQFLHEPPVSAADFLGARSRFKAKDLIGLLFRHFAGSRRAAAPRCRIVLQRRHANRAAGGQDTRPVGPGFRDRIRREARRGSIASSVIERACP